MMLRFLPIVAFALGFAASPASARDCEVTEEQRREASETDWQTFDQAGGVAGTFRDLASRQCYAEALEAYRSWLNHHGGFPDGRARSIGHFHIGQALAFTGNIDGAIAMIGKSYRDVDVEGDVARDWNNYVDGVLGYFAGDRQRIRDARERLWTSDRAFARRQAGVLDGLRKCIDKPYATAMSPSCRD